MGTRPPRSGVAVAEKYWQNLSEPRALPKLIRGAGQRIADLVERPVMSIQRPTRRQPALIPADAGNLAAIVEQAAGCRNCPLYAHATQTVFGEGPETALMMLVGEQPGDQEDLAGRPFVGPAGQLLDRALAEAGIGRAQTYVTNAVKHFKFVPRGKRRIHQKPDTAEIIACKPWLDLERVHVRPRLLVLMGASAARAVLGRSVTISRERGRPIAIESGEQALVTVHPSYLLRLPDEADRRREHAAFVGDLRLAAELIM